MAGFTAPGPVEDGRAVEIVGLHRRGPAGDELIVPPDPPVGVPGRKLAHVDAAVFPKIVIGLVIGKFGTLGHDPAEQARAVLVDQRAGGGVIIAIPALPHAFAVYQLRHAGAKIGPVGRARLGRQLHPIPMSWPGLAS